MSIVILKLPFLGYLFNKNYRRSYSQSGEDMIVDYIFQCIGIKKPSYIDIGAHDPYRLSNTAYFYQKGSRGINIEPDPDLIKPFNSARKKDINLNIGVGPSDGELLFYRMSSPTLNTFVESEAKRMQEKHNCRIVDTIPVKVFTLISLLQKFAKNKFPDFLSLDVEGYDLDILRSIPFETTAPIVICIETVSYETDGSGVKDLQITKLLEEKGYMLYADTYINSIFVKRNVWLAKLKDVS